MANQDVQAIIKRAYLDDTFRLGLMRDFDGTVEKNDLLLDDDERAGLSGVDWQNFGQSVGGGGSWVHIYST